MSIPYTLIIPSASRPHLFARTLSTLLDHVDQPPTRVIVHDDPVFPGKQSEVISILQRECTERALSFHLMIETAPISHGPSLARLLSEVETEYALYSQDDHVVLRTLPIQSCLAIMERYGLHHVRFNKRKTMAYKDTWQGRWYKKETQTCPSSSRLVDVTMHTCDDGGDHQTLTVSDHWYFQTSLWRVRPIRNVVNWFMSHEHERQWFQEHCEIKINRAFDGQQPNFPLGLINVPTGDDAERNQEIRARVQRTFIWGGIGEKAFIQHIGNDPKDFALNHPREELPACQ